MSVLCVILSLSCACTFIHYVGDHVDQYIYFFVTVVQSFTKLTSVYKRHMVVLNCPFFFFFLNCYIKDVLFLCMYSFQRENIREMKENT